MADPLPIEGRSQRVECAEVTPDMYLLKADIHEGIGVLTTVSVEFLTKAATVKPADFLGKTVKLDMDLKGKRKRNWVATCVEAEYLGMSEGMGYGEYPHFRLQLRAWPWLLTRTTDCKIFQEKHADDIVKQVFSDAGFSDVQWKVGQTPPVRVYCVQYRETDWDFVLRLLAEEGRFFYFDYKDGKDKLVISDDSAGLAKMGGEPKVPLMDKEAGQRSEVDYIDNWKARHRVATDKVTLNDYDFEKSKTKLTGTRQGKSEKYEQYDYPGRFVENADGTKLARRKLESITAGVHRVIGQGIVRELAAGFRFELEKHPTASENGDYLVVDARHSLQIERVDKDKPLPAMSKHDPSKLIESHSVLFEAQPFKTPYVPSPVPVPYPTISGVQTAEVVGPSGEEIYTDKFGRVKVQFHWDREGKKDENTTCWIRVATPIAGKTWGMIHIPRIGQEVVVQFEEGNPDRPLIVGSVYNDQQTVPFSLPDNKTQLGFVSDTHQNDDTKAKHELVFEEKKDSEFIRMQSEKDFTQIIKNSADVKIGTKEKPDGDFKQEVWRHTTRTYGVGSGEGNVTETIEMDFSKTLNKGNYTLDVDTGERKTNIKKDDTLDVKGNISSKTAKAMTLEATQKITLKCGGSKIEMTPSKITIQSTEVEVKGSAQVKAQGAIVDINGSGMVKVQGGIVKIN